MNEKKCPCCGAAIDFNASECKYCGEVLNGQQTQYQAPQVQQMPQQAPQYQPIQPPVMDVQKSASTSGKSKIAAGILAILFGGFGIHKFYLGKIGLGILYLVFCWTYIPSIIGFIEGIIYLTSSQEKFDMKYVNNN